MPGGAASVFCSPSRVFYTKRNAVKYEPRMIVDKQVIAIV
jgi:hypothetical protein